VVGSYVLNADCTLSVTLTDAFGTSNATTSLQGIVLNNGAEIDLGIVQNVASGVGGSTGTTGTANGLYESNVLIKLVRPVSAACATGELFGPYALIGTGTMVASTSSVSSTQTEAPFFLFSLVQFDGNGNVISPSGTPSTLGANLRYTGTYTVNPDCTGTMTITNAPSTVTGSAGSSSTTASSTLSLSFVVTLPTVPSNAAGTAAVRSTGPEIEFSQSSGTATLVGYGLAQ
jgi:hypothetical protein